GYMARSPEKKKEMAKPLSTFAGGARTSVVSKTAMERQRFGCHRVIPVFVAKETEMRRPLEGIKILDLTHGVAGPYCTMVLGDLGADIVKVELPKRGGATRYMNVSDCFETDIPTVGGDYFLAINRNKRSVTLELKSE